MEDTKKLVITGTEESVSNRLLTAFTPMSVTGADVAAHTANQTALEQSQNLNEHIGSAPKFQRQFVWNQDSIVRSKTVQWTETADPLPSPPPSKFANSQAIFTIHFHPKVFQVVTSINVDRFKVLLSSHPNQPFVQSVCKGLHEGFWPYPNTHYGDWPLTWDNSQ